MSFSKEYQYLALGDSYTIGEQVPEQENFPNQLSDLLRQKGLPFAHPRIIAKTGWTTDELQEGILSEEKKNPFRADYDLVTLLIGVNDQYRGRSLQSYEPAFEELLKRSIAFAGGKKENVAVLSIPDWGITPFAEGRDRTSISSEIDAYNLANKKICDRYNIYYIDITPETRKAANDPSLLAGDGLHPSGKEYKKWAILLAGHIINSH